MTKHLFSMMLSSLILSMTLVACDKKAPEPSAAEPPANAHPLVLAYDGVREALAVDDLAATQATAKALAEAGKAEAALAEAAQKVASSADLDAARVAFGDLSQAYIALLNAKAVLDPDKKLIAFRCPMAKGYKKWVQFGEPMRNPYMGKAMLECGAKVDLVP
jgi:hypothetical protein